MTWSRVVMTILAGCCCFLPACAHEAGPDGSGELPRAFAILAINDVYRIGGVDGGTRGGLARVRTLRVELEREYPDLLLLHAGDFLFPSLLSLQYRGEQMVDVLNYLDGDADRFDARMFVTFGNHEFDKDEAEDAALLDRRVEQSQFRWLGSNVIFHNGQDDRPVVEAQNLIGSAIVESGGVKVGLFSLTTNFKDPAYVKTFGDPQAIARRMTRELRGKGAEVVVALTHQRVSEDVGILRDLGPEGPDLIIGGHEHDKQKECVDGRCVIKADADARTASVLTVTLTTAGPPTVQHELQDLGPETPTPDSVVQAQVKEWFARHDREYCRQKLKVEAGCLEEVLGKTQVTLIGEELEIRKYETNLGNWIADQALSAFLSQGAQAAFINSGSLRLNQNIPENSPITRRHVEEIFPYPSDLILLRINGATLQQVVSHAVHDWTGNGWWLQISGFALRHDPARERADRLTLLTPQGPRPIDPDEELVVVTNGFVAKGGDEYTMLTSQPVVPSGPILELKQLVIEGLRAHGTAGIAPRVEGRICNPTRPLPQPPCQAIDR